MKSFIKHILIFLVIMIFATTMIQTLGNQENISSGSQVQENIDIIEGNISQGNEINDGMLSTDEPVFDNKSTNVMSNILFGIGNIFMQVINFVIKLIMQVISSVMSW